MIKRLGTKTLTAFMPFTASLNASITAAMAYMTAQQASFGFGITASMVPVDAASLTASLSGAANLIPSLALSIPDLLVGAKLALTVSIDTIGGIIAGLNAALQLIVAMSSTSVVIYQHEGAVNSFGPEFTSELSGGLSDGSGPAAGAWSIVLITTSPTTWAALKTFFAVS